MCVYLFFFFQAEDGIRDSSVTGVQTCALLLAADVTYFTGGQTSVNGVQDNDVQRNVRYGLTLSFPLSAQWSGKLAWSRGLTTSIGGNFQTISVALQYRWFNR